jgi:hypothetical protein
MTGMEEQRSSLLPVVVALLLALPILYVGTYVALVIPEGRIRNNEPFDMCYYRIDGGGVDTVFWPLQRLDKRLRPLRWRIIVTESEEWIPPLED